MLIRVLVVYILGMYKQLGIPFFILHHIINLEPIILIHF